MRSRLVLLFTTMTICSITLAAYAESTTELLWPAGAPGATGDEPKDKPTLIILCVEEKAPTAAVVVCPGGGYGALAMKYEGYNGERWLNSLGVSVFVLDYRHRGKGYGHPAPVQDVQRAIRTVRARAEEFGVDPKRIGVMGFSAGGHLASTAATHFDTGKPEADDPIERVSCRPDFAILCYPVILFGQPFTHLGSQSGLLGENPDPDLVASLSSEKHVTARTPPTFLFHTDADIGVPAENSVAFYLALRKHNVPTELHIYEHGLHGVGLAPNRLAISSWPLRCADWMRGRGILKDKEQ